MNILYGISATGNGHISRSRILISELKKRGHNITVLFSGRDIKDLFDTEEFEPFIVKEGFTFKIKNGKVQYFNTLLSTNIYNFIRDVLKIKNDFDVVVTDFEPISAFAAKKLNIPCIGVGHQYSFNAKIPMTLKMKFFSLFFPKFFTPVNKSIASHFYHFDQPILPPFIDEKLQNNNNVRQKKDIILVYLPWEKQDKMIDICSKIKSKKFIYYTNIDEQLEINNIILKPFSNINFKKDLMESEGVITNAGFQLPSECIFLGKKLLCKPLIGQPEQEHNAKILSDFKLATTCTEITASIINDWIKNNLCRRIQYKNPVKLMAKIIENPKIDFSNEINEIWNTNDNL